MRSAERSGPRTGRGPRAGGPGGVRDTGQGSGRRRATFGDLGRAGIDDLADACGRSHDGGPFTVAHGCPAPRPYFVPYPQLGAVRAVSPALARCGRCGREFTLWELRRIVLEDVTRTRRLAAAMATAR